MPNASMPEGNEAREASMAEGQEGFDVTVNSGEEVVSFRRPKRFLLVLSALTVLVCSVLILQAVLSAAEPAVELGTRPKIFSIEMPKMVDWRTEDAKSDRKLNRHLIVAETVAKSDGYVEKRLSPVSLKLLKEAQMAAKEESLDSTLD
jgi:hypothetical protein